MFLDAIWRFRHSADIGTQQKCVLILISPSESFTRSLLSEEEVSMCLWLASGWPPQMKVRDIRAGNRGELKL